MSRITQLLAGHFPILKRQGPRTATPPRSPSPLEGGDRHTIFTQIHQVNHWGDSESLSGPGSTLAYTQNIRTELPKLWERLGTRVILDAPSGDFNWFRAIPRSRELHYIGGDIVENLVRANRENYTDSQTRFMHLDIISGPLPDADFWLCRDCLFHLPTGDVLSVLRNFSMSRIPFLCTSVHPQCEVNSDIGTGDFRLLNLERPPFNFGKAIAYIDDWIEGYPQRQLALWHRRDVANALGLETL